MELQDAASALVGSAVVGLVVGACALVAPTLEARGDSGEVAETETLSRVGASLFRGYCVNCHGEEGRGDGPVAGYLKVRPADLTRLREGEEKTFPRERVRASIDGRQEVILHGPREMPIWGEAFVRPGDEPEKDVERRIDALVAFLESIQE